MGQLKRLVKLELVSSTVFSGEDLAALSSLQDLRHLEIGSVKFVTKYILQVLPAIPKKVFLMGQGRSLEARLLSCDGS